MTIYVINNRNNMSYKEYLATHSKQTLYSGKPEVFKAVRSVSQKDSGDFMSL